MTLRPHEGSKQPRQRSDAPLDQGPTHTILVKKEQEDLTSHPLLTNSSVSFI
jgi:hypothetical protein